jgi:hypothetical protein
LPNTSSVSLNAHVRELLQLRDDLVVPNVRHEIAAGRVGRDGVGAQFGDGAVVATDPAVERSAVLRAVVTERGGGTAFDGLLHLARLRRTGGLCGLRARHFGGHVRVDRLQRVVNATDLRDGIVERLPLVSRECALVLRDACLEVRCRCGQRFPLPDQKLRLHKPCPRAAVSVAA